MDARRNDQWQFDPEPCPSRRETRQSRFAAMQLGNSPHDGKTQTARSALLTVSAALKEAVKHPGLIFGADPWPGIDDFDTHALIVADYVHLNQTRRRRESQGVVEKV